MTDDMSTTPPDEPSSGPQTGTAPPTEESRSEATEPEVAAEPTGAAEPTSEGGTGDNAGTPETDTGTPQSDAGTTQSDAGTTQSDEAAPEGEVSPAEADPGAGTATEEVAGTEPAAPAVAATAATAAAATASGADAQAQIFESGYKPPPGTTGSSRIRRIARATLAVILIVLGILCLTLSPLTIWGRNLILNTDRYVDTLKPIAHNTGVQNAIVAAVDKQVDENIHVSDLVAQANLPPRVTTALGPALQSAISGLVNTVVTKFVQSKAFVALWVAINRTAHTQLVYFLTGSRKSGLKVNNQGELVLDLSPVVSTVKQQLVSAGLTVANHIPAVGATIEIAQVKGVEQVRGLVRFLNTLADWLPWIGLAFLAAGIATARRHRRTFIISMIGVAAGMIVIGIGLLIGRHFFQNGLPPDVLPTSTAGQVYDTVVRFLREGIRIVLVVALLLALIAWVLGPSAYAVTVRNWFKTGYRWTIDRIGRGSVGDFVGAHTMPITWATVGVGLIFFLLLGLGSLASIITIVVIFAILVALIQAVGLTNTHYRAEVSSTPTAGA
jgi:hypothetical protein